MTTPDYSTTGRTEESEGIEIHHQNSLKISGSEYRNSNEFAVDRYVTQIGIASEALERLTQYVEDHGEIGPDEVNWGHVGQMADLAGKLDDMVNWIDGKGEYAES